MKRIVSITAAIVVLLVLSIAEGATTSNSTNRIATWLDGKDFPRLDAKQAEAFAQKQQRRPEALLAAYQASNERVFLREAMAKHPRDPRVVLAAACPAGPPENNPAANAERRKWLDTLKQILPDNGLAYYLSAADHFKSGKPEIAEQEVLAGGAKPLRDYAVDSIQNTEAAYRAGGYAPAEAKALAMITLFMPHLAQLRDLGADLVSRANYHHQSGNTASADKMLRAAMKLGSQIDRTNSLTILENLVGIGIQQNALKALDPSVAFGDSGETVQVQIDRLSQRRTALRATAQEFNKRLATMSESNIGNYFEQQRRVGEAAAEQLALRK